MARMLVMLKDAHGRKAHPREVVAETEKLEGRQAAPLLLLIIKQSTEKQKGVLIMFSSSAGFKGL